jgi:hypothetical protein
MRCDLCDLYTEKNTHVFVQVTCRGVTQTYCSRFCVIHALVAEISSDIADGALTTTKIADA